MSSLQELLRFARSYRTYDESRTVSEDELISVIENVRLTNTAMNTQELKYRLVTEKEEVAQMIQAVRWAGRLTVKLPPEGKAPTAFLVICHDAQVADMKPVYLIDAGIAAEAIVLSAAEKGLGCCMLGSFSEAHLKETLSLPATLTPLLVISFGKPEEAIEIVDALPGTDVGYYRREDGTHIVPKRTAKELIITKKR